MLELSVLLSKVVETPVWMLVLLKVTALLATAWLLHFSLRRANPRWRVLLWRGVAIGLIAMPVVMAVMPAIELSVAKPVPETVIPTVPDDTAFLRRPILPETPRTEPIATSSVEPLPVTQERQPSTIWAHMRFWSLPAVWILGVAVLAFRFRLGHRRVKKLVVGSKPAPQTVITECRRVAEALRCRTQVDVRSVTGLSVPFLTGLRRPVLLLPEHMCDPAYSADLPGIVAHELSHLCSRDLSWGYVLHWISIGLWFHPLLWPVRSAHASACEQVSDSVSAHFVGDAHAYSRTLARVVVDIASRPPATAGIPIARTSDIARRLKALKRRVFSAPLSRRRVLALIVTGLLGVAILGAVHVTFTRTTEEEDAQAEIPPEVRQQVERLSSDDAGERAEAAQKLRHMAESGAIAVPYLIGILESGSSREPRDHPAVRDVLPDVEQFVSRLYGEPPGEPGVDAAIDDHLVSLFLGGDVGGRVTAVRALGAIGDSRAVDPLVAALSDRYYDVRRSAAQVLGEIGTARAVDGLIAALSYPYDTVLQERAAHALGEIGDPRAIQPLIAALIKWDVREEAEEALRKLGPPAIEALIAAMTAGGPHLRAQVALVLGRTNDGRVVNTLVAALKDKEGRVREAAASALGETRDARALEPLIAALADEEGRVRAEAALALGRLEDSRAVQPLIGILKDQDKGVQRLATDALGMIGEPAVAPLLPLLEEEEQLRLLAIQALGKMKGGQVVQHLVPLLHDDSFRVRWQVVQALGETEDSPAVEPLIQALGDKEAIVRGDAAGALSKITGERLGTDQATWREWWEENKGTFGTSVVAAGSEASVTEESVTPQPTTVEAPATAANIEVEEERTESAADTVRREDISPEVQKYLEMLASSDSTDRTNAARRLGRLVEEARDEALPEIEAGGAVELLIDALRDKDWGVRSETATALGKIGDARATLALAAALKDKDAIVRGNAAWALSQIRDTRAVEPLIAALKDEDRPVREHAAEALGELKDSRAVEPLIAALNDRKWGERALAVQALGTIKDKRAVDPLIRTLRDRDPTLRGTAAEALGEIGDARAVEPLVATLKVRGSWSWRNIDSWVLPSHATLALGKIGEPAVEPLIPLLGYRNKYTRGFAAAALGQIGDSRAVEPLIARLRDRDPDVRGEVAGALGHIKDKRAVEPLIAALQDKDKSVRKGAAEALGNIEDARVVEPLVEALGDKSLLVRRGAAAAIENLKKSPDVGPVIAALKGKHAAAVSAMGKETEPRDRVKELVAALKDPDWIVRDLAAGQLEKTHDASAVQPLAAALNDKESWVRRSAAQALAEIEDTSATEVLIDALKHRDGDVRRVAAQALADRGDSRAVEPLIGALKDRDQFVTIYATQALLKIGAAATEQLVAVLEEGESDVRRPTIPVLGKIGDARAVDPLITVLVAKDDPDRASAARALGAIGDSRAVDALLVALADRDEKLRSSAAEALGEIGSARAVEPLIARLKDANESVRTEAANALGKIKDSRAVDPLVDALKQDSGSVRLAAARALGQIQDGRAAEPLIAALKDEDERLRGSAEKALANIGTPAVEPLITLIEDKDRGLQTVAAQVLGQIDDTRSVGPLIAALEDEDWGLRKQAAVSLGKIKDARAVVPLIAAVDDGVFHVKWAAISALGEVGDSRAVQPLIAALGGEPPIPEGAAASLEKITGQNFGQDQARWQAWWEENKTGQID